MDLTKIKSDRSNGTHKFFKYETCKIQVDILSKEECRLSSLPSWRNPEEIISERVAITDDIF